MKAPLLRACQGRSSYRRAFNSVKEKDERMKKEQQIIRTDKETALDEWGAEERDDGQEKGV